MTLKMQFMYRMAATLMGNGCGWNSHIAGEVTLLSFLTTLVVEDAAVVCLGIHSIVTVLVTGLPSSIMARSKGTIEIADYTNHDDMKYVVSLMFSSAAPFLLSLRPSGALPVSFHGKLVFITPVHFFKYVVLEYCNLCCCYLRYYSMCIYFFSRNIFLNAHHLQIRKLDDTEFKI